MRTNDRRAPVKTARAAVPLRRERVLPQPGLRSSEQREADEAPHDEVRAAVIDMEFASVYRAVLGIEDVPAAVFPVRRLHVADDEKADDRLVLALIGADLANAFLGTGLKAPLDASEKLPVLLGDAYDRPGVAGLVIEGLPETERRTAGRRYAGRRSAIRGKDWDAVQRHRREDRQGRR